MKLLFTGRGTSGSWQIRGVQLGNAIGAVVNQHAGEAECKAADVIVVVKRISDEALATIRHSETPWVFDVLDCYPQPLLTDQVEAVHWVQTRIRRLDPNAVIWPNQRMRDDCDDGRKGIVLRHHHRPGIKPNPIRPHVKVIGYEGSVAYLEHWRSALDAQCQRRGWSFVQNPDELADLDIVIAARGGKWNNYPSRHWKSNVKLANAHGSGTPFVGQPESGYEETATGCEYWTEGPDGLAVCFDWLVSQSAREQVSNRFRQAAYPVEQAAKDLGAFLERVG